MCLCSKRTPSSHLSLPLSKPISCSKRYANRIRKTEKRFLVDLGLYIAVVLLARCGMRISEPLKLLRQHYRRDDATVFIDRTKFKKQRLVPLPKAAITELENYLSVRRHLVLSRHQPLSVGRPEGAAVAKDQLRRRFRQALTDIGLASTSPGAGQSQHQSTHTPFATSFICSQYPAQHQTARTDRPRTRCPCWPPTSVTASTSTPPSICASPTP